MTRVIIDNNLLLLGSHKRTRILTLNEFLASL